MADPAAVLQLMMVANTKPAELGLARVQGRLRATEATSKSTAATMKKAMLGVGLAVGAAGVALYKMGEEFDDAYDKIRTTTGATGKELEKLKQNFRDVVSDVPASFEDASTAVADLNTRLGLTGKPLEKMAEQVTELSRITGTDVKGNVEDISKAFVDWDVKTKQMGKTLDGFYRVSQESGASVSELTAAVQQFGSPLRQLGFNLDEAASMWATFVRAGVNTSTMVPGLKLALASLTAPTDELKTKMEDLGIAVGKPDKALQQVFDLLGNSSTLSQIDKTTLAMEVFGKRAGADMAEAIRQGRFEVEDMLKVFNDGSDTIRKSGRDTMDLSEHWQQFTNLLKVKLEPVAEKVFTGLGKLMKEVTKTFRREGAEGVLDLFAQKLSDALPKITELGGKIGLKLAGALVKGFWEAPILGKLFVAGVLFAKFGGAGAIKSLGGKSGGIFGKAFVAATILALPLLVPEAYKLGKKLGFALKNAFNDVFSEGGPVDNVLGGDHIVKFTDYLLKGVDDLQEAANKLARVDMPWSDKQAALAEKFGVSTGKASDALNDAMVKAGRMDNALAKTGKAIVQATRQTTDFGDKSKKAYKGASGGVSDFERDSSRKLNTAGKNTDRLKDKSVSSFGAIGGAAANAGSVVSQGLQLILDNTKKSMDKFEVKFDAIKLATKIGNAATKKVGQFQRGGHINMGAPSGDSVPAMLERDEYVLNRKAVRAIGKDRLDAINFGAAKRFQKGGSVGGVSAMMALANRFDAASEPYSLGGGHGSFLTSPSAVDCSGAVSAILHAGGLLDGAPMDTVALAGWGKAATGKENLVVATRPITGSGGHTVMSINGRVFGTSGENPNGGAGWLSSSNPRDYVSGAVLRTMDVSGGVLKKIARVLLEGPDGPFKSLGQSALDKSRNAANKFIASKMPQGSLGGGDMGSFYNGPLDRVFPSHSLADAAGHVQLTDKQVGTVARGAGLPSAMVPIAQRESQFYPGVIGDDAAAGYGNTFGYGLWQITSGPGGKGAPNGDLIQSLGGMNQMFNPVTNSEAAKALYNAGGMSPWDASTYQRGGLVGMQKGGLVGDIRKLYDILGKAKGEYETPVLKWIKKYQKKLAKQQKHTRGKRLDKINEKGSMKFWRQGIAKTQGTISSLEDNLAGIELAHGHTEPREIEDILAHLPAGLGKVDPDAASELWRLTDGQRFALVTALQKDYGLENSEVFQEVVLNKGIVDQLMLVRKQMILGVLAAKKKVREAEKAIRRFEQQKKKAQSDAKQIGARINQLQKNLAKARGDKAPERRKNEKPKDYQARVAAWGKRHRQKIDLMGDHLARQRFDLGQVGGKINFYNRAIGAYRGNIRGFNDFTSETNDSLIDVQGVNRSTDPNIKVNYGDVLTFGGKIRDIQDRIFTLGGEMEAVPSLDFAKPKDDSAGPSYLDVPGLLEFAKAIRLGVMDSQLPKYHTGGVIPGAPRQEVPIMAQAGEGVFTREQMAAMAPSSGPDEFYAEIVNWNDGTVRFRKIAQDEMNRRERAEANRHSAGVGV